MPTSKDTQKDTQKSLQKELVKDIAKRANTLNLQDIQEGWKLAGAIADRQAALQKELQGYKDEILASQATLKSLRTKVAECKSALATLESKERQARQELARLHDEISIQTIIKESKLANEKLQESRKQILPGSLKSVEIYLKDGSIAKAKPAQKLFGEDVYKKYRVAFKENHTLKSRLSELELENKRLHIELRDFYSELALEGMGALESSAKDQPLPEPKEIIATDEDLSDFKKMLKAQKKTKD